MNTPRFKDKLKSFAKKHEETLFTITLTTLYGAAMFKLGQWGYKSGYDDGRKQGIVEAVVALRNEKE